MLCLWASGAAAQVVVEVVVEGGAAAVAGIREGDVLESWRRGLELEEEGELRTPFDLEEIDVDQGQRPGLTLFGRRAGEPLEVTLPAGRWELRSRPTLSESELASYREARTRLEEGAVEAGAAEARRVADGLVRRHRGSDAAAILVAAAEQIGDSVLGEELFREALDVAEGPIERARVWEDLGRRRQSERRNAEAVSALRQALRIRERAKPEALATAEVLYVLGTLLSANDQKAADELLDRALAMRTRIAPGSLPQAGSLVVAGLFAQKRGELEAAADYQDRALEIYRELDPDSRNLAIALTNRGYVAWEEGNLITAEDYYRGSLRIYQRLLPDSLELAGSYNNLGIIARSRFNLDAAGDYHRRALEIRERIDPESPDVAMSLNNLGLVSWNRGDLDGAHRLFERSLELKRRLKVGSLSIATTVDNLGEVALEAGDLEGALSYFERGLAIRSQIGPESYEAARLYYNFSRVFLARGELDRAASHQRRALALARELTPGTAFEAAVLQEGARLAVARHEPEQAAGIYAEAEAALELQEGRLGGGLESYAFFRSRFIGIYHEHLQTLLALDRKAEAFAVLERSRARAFLAALAERPLRLDSEAPELEQRRRQILARGDRLSSELALLSAAGEGPKRETLRAELREVRRQQQELRAAMRAASPRTAALRYADPIGVVAAQRTLRPGTCLLAWSVGERDSALFAVSAEHVDAVRLPAGEKGLRKAVEVLRRRIERREAAELIREQGAELAELLLRPAVDCLAEAERLVLLPDGPLWLLPFAALADPTTDEPRWLVESWPLSVVASATVLAELRSRPAASRATTRVVAFGDPAYTTPARSAEAEPGAETARMRAVLRAGLTLVPLPASRLEVESLGRLYPDAAELWLGEEASEERAKSVGRESAIVHFATHAFVDAASPLESALALAIPDDPGTATENGLLQAWEIFESLRLDAELVTLSACETALGREVHGEGILGLTRAFQHAGARSVLASLWRVADRSTAHLMARFYGYLRDGVAKDEALRRAQLDFLRAAQPSPALRSGPGPERSVGGLVPSREASAVDPSASAPFAWAGFVLNGDGR